MYVNYTTFEKDNLLLISKVVNEKFSEQEILELQDDFLTNGFHYLIVKDVKTGRDIVTTFLRSLNVYQEVACLTCASEKLPADIYDIKNNMIGQCFEKNYLEGLFLEEWCFDFLWIEVTDALLAYRWLPVFNRLLMTSNVAEVMPVFILSYAANDYHS